MKITRKDSQSIRINPTTSALLVIDMQRAFFEKGPFELPAASKMVSGIRRLIDQCRKAGMQIVFTRIYHDDMGDGIYPVLFPDHFTRGKPRLKSSAPIYQIIKELTPEPDDIIIDKSRYSAFFNTKLESILRGRNVESLLIVGLATNVCCESTARDAFFRNFRVIVLSDLNVTYSKEAHEASLENIRNCFGFVAQSSDISKLLDAKANFGH